MQAARLFFGQGGGNKVFLADPAATHDDSVDFDLLATTNRVAPGGVGGEAIFVTLWLAVTHTMAVVIAVTPVLDGVELETQTVTLGALTDRAVSRFRLGLSVPFLNPLGTEVMRVAARGCWLQTQVASAGGMAAGDLIIEGCELEHEVVRAAQPAEAVP